jgi:hypothetical protein
VATKITLQILATSFYKVECELYDHLFAFRCTSVLQESRTASQPSDMAALRQQSYDTLDLQVENHKNSLSKLDYSVVPAVRCPNCKYMQSWMIDAAKNARAQLLAAIPVGLLLIAGSILIYGLSFIAFFFSFLVLVVASTAAWYLLKKLIFNKWNYDPNKGQKASTIKLPVVKLRMDRPAERVSGGIVNKKVKMITLETFEAESVGSALILSADHS